MTSNKIFLLFTILVVLFMAGCATVKQAEPQKADPFNLVELADRAYARSQWLDAEYYYKTITQQVQNDPYAWLRLGNVYLRQQKFESAVHAYHNSLQRNAEQPKAYYNLGTAYMLLARESMQKSQQMLPAHDSAQQLITNKLEALNKQIFMPLADTSSASSGLIEQAAQSD